MLFRSARKILTRDIERVCEYFQNLGLQVDEVEIANTFWKAYGTEAIDPGIVMFNILEAVSFDDYEAKEYDD